MPDIQERKGWLQSVIKVISTPAFILCFFGLIYCDISLLDHYLFRTSAWDLGIFNHALYSYAHLKWDISMVRIGSGPDPFPKNLLSDHFELYPLLAAPLYYIFYSYTLLVIQVVSILWGGYGVYKFILLKTGNERFSKLALIHFFCMWGIYTALAFDYHNNVVAAMGISWFLYYFEKNDFKRAALVFLFVIVGKENMPLWLGFIGLALALWSFKDKQKFRAGLVFSISGFVAFVIIIKLIIPSFAPVGHKTYAYNTFTALGNGYGEVLKTIFLHPFYTFSLLFVNHLHEPVADGMKMATHIAVIVSGGWALFYRPKYLFMLLPVYGQKLFYDQFFRWGVYYQYSIEWAPIITIALFLALYSIFSRYSVKTLYRICLLSILLAAGKAYQILDSSDHRNFFCFWVEKHYTRRFDVSEAYKALSLIPANASVSAHCIFVPHLAFRDTIYQYPFDSGKCRYYAFVSAMEAPFESFPEEFAKERITYSDTRFYEPVYVSHSIMIFKRK